MARALLFIALLSLAAAPRAAVFDPDLHWFSLASEHFIVHYHEGEGTLAHQTLAIAEGVHRRLSQEFRWTPRGRTEIVLSDQADLANGYATPLPANRIVLFATSPRDVMDHSTWFELLITHEYAHILHLDKAEGFPRWFRKVFGRFLLFFPNLLQPAWYVEGLATYYETDPQRGLGRGQSTAFDMLMRMEVAAGVKPLKQINQRVASWPAGQVPYLYGVSFYQFLAERHGGRRIRQWVDEYSDNIIPFRLSANARRVTRRTSAQLYDEFEQYLVEKYRPQLAAIRAAGVVSGKPLSHHGYATALPRVAADGTVYYIRADGRRRARLMALAPGAPQSRPLTKVTVVAALDSHPEQGLLLSQLELCRATRWYFDLYRVNPANGHRRRLTHCGRYRAAAWSPSGHRIAAVANGLGNNRLVLLDQEGQELDTLWQGTAGEIVLGLDWAPNGDELVAAVWREQGGWNLEAFSLRERRWHPLTADSALERDPRYSADGRSVLFSADYGGVYNLRRLDRASGAITTLSNVEGGAFAPSQGTAGGPIYYAGYHADGYNLYRLDAPLAQPTRPLAGPTALAGPAPASPTTDEVRPYAPWRGLLPRWWLPHLVAEHDDRYEIGLITSGWDALQRHSYALTAAYDIEQDLALGALDYVYNRWRPALRLHASRWNDFYRQGKTLRRIRHADTLEAELGYPWLRFDHRWSAHLGLIQERKSDAWTAPGVGALADTEDNVLGLALSYDSTHFPPLAISRAEGRNITLVAEDSEVLGGDYTGAVYTLDWREFVPLGQRHTLALRGVAGWGTAAPRPFRLGGSDSARGTAVVPNAAAAALQPSPFNQRTYALRGYPEGLPRLSGRRLALASGEWRFPLSLIERGIMAPPMGLEQLSGKLFVDSGATWDGDGGPEGWATGAGVELVADANVFYLLNFRLRLGYAHGFDSGGGNHLYLRLGASF